MSAQHENLETVQHNTLETVLAAYIECALWSSTDNTHPEGDDPLDRHHSESDLAGEALDKMRHDCRCFLAGVANLSNSNPDVVRLWTDEQLGHDFWLTRNGHGTGFWDRGHGAAGANLTTWARSFGESDLYVGDDGQLYVC